MGVDYSWKVILNYIFITILPHKQSILQPFMQLFSYYRGMSITLEITFSNTCLRVITTKNISISCCFFDVSTIIRRNYFSEVLAIISNPKFFQRNCSSMFLGIHQPWVFRHPITRCLSNLLVSSFIPQFQIL